MRNNALLSLLGKTIINNNPLERSFGEEYKDISKS